MYEVLNVREIFGCARDYSPSCTNPNHFKIGGHLTGMYKDGKWVTNYPIRGLDDKLVVMNEEEFVRLYKLVFKLVPRAGPSIVEDLKDSFKDLSSTAQKNLIQWFFEEVLTEYQDDDYLEFYGWMGYSYATKREGLKESKV